MMDDLSRAIHSFFNVVSQESDYAVLLETPCLVESNSSVIQHHLNMVGWSPCRVLSVFKNRITLIQNIQHGEKKTSYILPADHQGKGLQEEIENWLKSVQKKHRVFLHAGYESLRWMDSEWEEVIFPDGEDEFPEWVWVEMEHWATWHRQEATRPLMGDDLSLVPFHVQATSKSLTSHFQSLWQQIQEDIQQKPQSQSPPQSSSQTEKKASHVVDRVVGHAVGLNESDVERYTLSVDEGQFKEQVQSVLKAIQSGDLYQANVSLALSKQTVVTPMQIYQQLVAQNPSPFGGVFKLPEGTIVSNSPERLVDAQPVDVQHGQGDLHKYRVSCRPIAGTRGRKEEQAEDASLGESLRHDLKEQAEHVMLVDLIRNDLGRVAMAGSVAVDELMVIERYRHVMHMVSHVSGMMAREFKKDEPLWEHLLPLLKATFPGGTITGCPKIRCVERLAQLEEHRRGPYTGSMGYWNPETGAMDLNILIRTALMTPCLPDEKRTSNAQVKGQFSDEYAYNLSFCVGAGLVMDSVAEYEYKECLRKSTSMRLAVLLAEHLH